jgi:hypothetical protein
MMVPNPQVITGREKEIGTGGMGNRNRSAYFVARNTGVMSAKE